MKIVVTGTRGIPNVMGGVETHCEELFPRIAAMGADVTVIRLISQNTIEEKIVRLQDMKQMLSDNIMDGTSDTARLSYEEILELLQK